ncbi:MAG: ATP-binding protein [Sphingomicrobium sp.]
MLTRNAERHSENAEFRVDMIATLKGSIGKMNDLLARLSPRAAARPHRVEPQPLHDILLGAIAALRAHHEFRLLGDCGQWAQVDPAALEQALGHLLQNAIEASPADEPVTVRVSLAGDEVTIAIFDKGGGMDADFVRSQLFQPFASTKPAGFGIGAFEARALIAAMGGRIDVESRPGDGTQFTIHLTAAEPAPLKQRKIA